MKILKLNRPVSVKSIKDKMSAAKSSADFKRWQILYFVSCYQVDAAYLSDITGYSKANVYAVIQQYNNSETQEISVKARGGRRCSLMSVAQEQELMKGLEQRALQGQILSYLDIKKLVEHEVGRNVSDDYIWDLFKRNGWTRHSPRPHHPKRNAEAQQDFKKNSRSVWLPLKMILEQR